MQGELKSSLENKKNMENAISELKKYLVMIKRPPVTLRQ